MNLSRNRVLFVAALLLLSLFWSTLLLAGAAVLPKTDKKFERIGSWGTLSLSVNQPSRHQVIDGDGDLLSGAMFQGVFSPAKLTSDGAAVVSFIQAVIAVCGTDGLLIVDTKFYGNDGELTSHVTQPTTVFHQRVPGSAGTQMYKYLCDGKGNKRVPGNSYT